MNRNRKLIILFLSVLIISCIENSKKPDADFSCNYKTDELSEFITSRNKDFEILFMTEKEDEKLGYFIKNAHIFSKNSIELLKCNKLSSLQKSFVITAMNGLEFDNYLNYANTILDGYKNGIISESELMYSLNDFWSRDNHIIRNYSNKKVEKLIKEIKLDKKLSVTSKSYLDMILSGKAWEEKKEHYRQAFIQNKSPLPKGVELLPDSYEKYK